jgi:UDP:flavonoid glycosyltransferase YjiC (YdhE family)
MRVAVITYGTKADTRPLVALCCGLMQAGHEVHMLADRSTLPIAYAHGVPTTTLAGDMRSSIAPGGALSAALRQGADAREMVRAAGQVAAEHSESWLLDLIGAAEGADAIVCSSYTSFVGLSAAEYLRIPVIGAGLWPLTPTREFPCALLPSWQLPTKLNRLTHEALNALIWRRFRPHLNRARQLVCAQAPRMTMWNDFPIIYGISRHLVPQPTDWPRWCRISGAWALPELDWQPPLPLMRFLNAGEAPIYIGFGSLVGNDHARTLRTVIDAVAGRRALFYPGGGGVDGYALPRNFHVLQDTPHDWLFPRTSLVVHHGGAGTSHAATRAGVPSVVVPFANDQFFWADRLAALGVAPRHVPGPKLDAEALARMIDAAQQPEVRQRARALGTAMAQEDGLGQAVQWIEHCVQRLGHRPGASQMLPMALDSRP